MDDMADNDDVADEQVNKWKIKWHVARKDSCKD